MGLQDVDRHTERENAMRVGIVGVGLLGAQHAKLAITHPDVTLSAVADTRLSVGRKVSAETDSQHYRDYKKMLALEELECVIIATPDPLHRDPVVAAAQAGIPHIITEKPLATTVSDARRMRDAVARSTSELHILFPNRFNPLDRVVHYAVQAGLLGLPVHGDVRLDDNISVPLNLWGKRSKAWAGGSSTAHFLLSHVVDLLRWYFHPADVAEVFAITQNRVLGFTPDLYDAYLTFDSGMTVRVKAEWTRRFDALVEFELTFSGDRGGIAYRKHPAFRSQRGLRLDTSGESRTSLERHMRKLNNQGIRGKVVSDPKARSPQVMEFYGEDNPLDWDTALHYYLSAIAHGKSDPDLPGFGPLPGMSDALRQVDIVAAIVKSAKTGRAQRVVDSRK